MKVLRIITRLNVGGPARQTLALQPEMARLGIDETLVTGHVDAGEADLSQMLDVHNFVRVPTLIRPVQPATDIKGYRDIKSLIRELRPDVVHTHLSKAGLLGRLAAIRRHVPVTVHTFHGHVLEGYFSNTFGRTIKSIERAVGRRTSALLAVGEGVRQDLIRLGIAPADRVQVVPAGIDLTPFKDIGEPGGELRSQLGIPGDAVLIGYVGRFVPVKRLDRLLDAARRVAEEIPYTHFLLCGEGPDYPIVTEAAAQPPLAGRIHLLGWVANLRKFYEAVDMVVLTSANEGTPISLIESGAAGRPVVSTRVGGVGDVVEDGKTGLLADSASSVADGLIELVNDRDRARRMGAAGRKRVMAKYSAARLAADLVGIYEKNLLNPPRR